VLGHGRIELFEGAESTVSFPATNPTGGLPLQLRVSFLPQALRRWCRFRPGEREGDQGRQAELVTQAAKAYLEAIKKVRSAA